MVDDLNITTEEVARVFPKLDLPVRQAIVMAVLAERNRELEKSNADLSHQVEILEAAVKMPQGYERAPDAEALHAVRQAVGSNGSPVRVDYDGGGMSEASYV